MASDPLVAAQPETEARPNTGFVPPKPHELAGRFPQFEILDLLGYGGMGAVYKARQKSLDRLVALKIIRPEANDDRGFAARFAREAKALAKLNHSNIVSVYDFGQSSHHAPRDEPSAQDRDFDASGEYSFGAYSDKAHHAERDGYFVYYFVMEYVDGTNLRQLIETKELSPGAALQIIPQVCEALQYAHDEGIVHRDIKPENILVDSRGRVKIADFGLAKLLGTTSINEQTLTGTHQVMGTPRYMAPEQMEGSKAVDHRADIYSLGVVFYEMLTGELPMGSFEPPSRKVKVDVRLDEIVLRSLAKEPERRYQHASDVKTDVESISQAARADAPAEAWSTRVRKNDELSPDSRATVERHIVEQQLRRAGKGLFITGLVSLVFWIGLVGTTIILLILQIRRGDDIDLDPIAFWLLLIAIPLPIALSVIFVFASGKLLRLESGAWAVASAVIAVIPFSPAWLIGLPLGVWALAVLREDGAREVFTSERPLPQRDSDDPPLKLSRLVVGLCIVSPVLVLIGFALWYAQTAWVLAALAIPWLGVCADQAYHEALSGEKSSEKAAKLLLLFTFLLTIGLIALAIAVENSAWPLFGLAPALVGGFVGFGLGYMAGEAHAKNESAAAVDDDSADEIEEEEVEEDEEESPQEKLEWTAWWIGLVGAVRAWGLLSGGGDVFEKIIAGEESLLDHNLLLQLTGPVMVIAGIAAYHARFYWFAVAGAVLCLPTGNCLPVFLGIYSLVALFDPKVRALFLANEALLSATGSASGSPQITAKPPMPRGYGDAFGSTLSNAWTEWWRERDALFTRGMQTVIMLLHLVCLLAFLGFAGKGGTNDEGPRVFTHQIGFPSPWFTIETKAAHPDFSFNHEIHWSTSAWLVAGLGLGLAYIYCRIEKVRNPELTFWHKPESFMLIWAVLAIADIGLGAGMGYLSMNVKQMDETPSKQVAEAGDAKADVPAEEIIPQRQPEADEWETREDLSHAEPVAEGVPQVAALMQAAEEGDVGRVKDLLRAGVDPNSRDANGGTALMKAAGRGDAELIDALHAADFEARDKSGRTAVFYAIENRQVNYITSRIDMAQEFLASWSPLAYKSDRVINAQALSVRDSAGQTPLQLAEELEIEAVTAGLRKYLQAVIDANTRRIVSGMDPVSSRYRERGVARRALGQIDAADIDQREAARLAGAKNGSSRIRSASIHEACGLGDAGRVKELLDEGASVNEKDVAGRTLLMKAIASGNRSLALTLIVLGADLTEQDELGRSALMYAVEAKDKVFLSRLRALQQITYNENVEERRANLRAFSGVERPLLDDRDDDLGSFEMSDLECQADENGETASLIAAHEGDWELFSQVATTVDSIKARDKHGRTIAMSAAIHGHSKWFELIDDPNYFGIAGKSNFIGEMLMFDLDQLALTDSEGKTVLQLAEDNGHAKIADILRRHLQAIVDNQTAEIDNGGNDVAKHQELRRQAWRALGETDKAKEDLDKANEEVD